jgi:hypothetical protein
VSRKRQQDHRTALEEENKLLREENAKLRRLLGAPAVPPPNHLGAASTPDLSVQFSATSSSNGSTTDDLASSADESPPTTPPAPLPTAPAVPVVPAVPTASSALCLESRDSRAIAQPRSSQGPHFEAAAATPTHLPDGREV